MARATVFLLKVLPMLPSGALDHVTPTPVISRCRYPTLAGMAEGDLYRPSSPGPHPGLVVCLGVVPFGVDHPQVPRLGEALARAGFATLLYWSPAMRDLRLDADDIENLALAYDHLLKQPYIDPRHSGFIGTCVGGAFSLMAAAHPLVRNRVAFVGAFAPYAHLRTFARDIASASTVRREIRAPWAVDPLTREVYVRTVTEALSSDEAELLRDTMLDPRGVLDDTGLSPDARCIVPLLTVQTVVGAEAMLQALPLEIQHLFDIMSPLTYVHNIRAPAISIMHDRDDDVIPISESRQLGAALAGHRGLRVIEFEMFQHADPTKRKLRPWRLLWELAKFYRAVSPIFQQAVSTRTRHDAVAA